MKERLTELLGQLVNLADSQLPGKTGKEKEDWALARLTDYVEANDAEFLYALVDFANLPIPHAVVKKLVDNDLADSVAAMALSIAGRTAIRQAYAIRFVKENLKREDVLTPEEEQRFKAAEDALLKEGVGEQEAEKQAAEQALPAPEKAVEPPAAQPVDPDPTPAKPEDVVSLYGGEKSLLLDNVTVKVSEEKSQPPADVVRPNTKKK